MVSTVKQSDGYCDGSRPEVMDVSITLLLMSLDIEKSGQKVIDRDICKHPNCQLIHCGTLMFAIECIFHCDTWPPNKMFASISFNISNLHFYC